MMTFKMMLILFIAVMTVISLCMIIDEICKAVEERKEQKREMRNRDMIARDERLKREAIEHNRQQLALEYLCEKGADKQ